MPLGGYLEDPRLFVAVNVLRVGARGDSNYTNAGGTDDTAAIQAAIDSSVEAGGVPCIEFPAKRTYKISSTINVPAGVTIKGIGGRVENDVCQPATIVWAGSAGGTMFDCALSTQNIRGAFFQDIAFTQRVDNTNPPATLLKFRGTGGASTGIVDTGTGLRNCQFFGGEDQVRLENGSTNFFIEHGRFDNWAGYALYCTGTNNITIDGNCTMAMGAAANGSATVDGIIFLDGETAGVNVLRLVGLHLEVDTDCTETWTAGAGAPNPYDRCGLIRLGVDAAESDIQHHIDAFGLTLDAPFNIASFSTFQVTSGSSADSNLDTARMVRVQVLGGRGLHRYVVGDSGADDEIRIIGGRVHNNERPPSNLASNTAHFDFSVGKNSNAASAWSWANSRSNFFRVPVMEPRTFAQLPTDFPREGMFAYITDCNTSTRGATAAGSGSNKVNVRYDGSNWIVV